MGRQRLFRPLPRIADAHPVTSTRDFCKDLAAHVLEVEGEPVHLTPIEWKMLEVFVKHKGALVEAQTLLTEVWGPEFGKERNYLRVYMSQLRSKLEADPARPQYLHTQMGIGYRFTP